jgi:hypothetical protein
MRRLRRALQGGVERSGYVIRRRPANRFDDMPSALGLRQRAGYSPRVVVDAGANMGTWTEMV